jgi:hypothetical protein
MYILKAKKYYIVLSQVVSIECEPNTNKVHLELTSGTIYTISINIISDTKPQHQELVKYNKTSQLLRAIITLIENNNLDREQVVNHLGVLNYVDYTVEVKHKTK